MQHFEDHILFIKGDTAHNAAELRRLHAALFQAYHADLSLCLRAMSDANGVLQIKAFLPGPDTECPPDELETSVVLQSGEPESISEIVSAFAGDVDDLLDTYWR